MQGAFLVLPAHPQWRSIIRILLTGGSGFIGSRVARALVDAGHIVTCTARRPRSMVDLGLPCRVVAVDFERAVKPADWLPWLADVDVVVNAVGILRETAEQHFEQLHITTPRALFAASVTSGVRRVVQISALGADAGARSRYHLSKKAADDYLLGLPVSAVVVQPSLIYGPGGASATLFDGLASLPVIPLPGRGEQRVQPVHIEDAVAAIVALVEGDDFSGERVPLVGPRPVLLRELLGYLRQAMGLAAPRFLPVPLALVHLGAMLGKLLPGSLLDSDTLHMLERGNIAPATAITQLLGHPPRSPAAFVAPAQRAGVCTMARLSWLLPLLRWSMALLWIVTALLSFGLYPVDDSYFLLEQVGIPRWAMPIALYGAASIDLLLGLGILLARRRRWLWQAQIVLVLAYSALITWHLPEFWLHPFGPVLKNLPLLACLMLLLSFEER